MDDWQEDGIVLVRTAALERAGLRRDFALPPPDDLDVVVGVDADDELAGDRGAHELSGHATGELRVPRHLAIMSDLPDLHPMRQRHRDELPTAGEVEHGIQEIDCSDDLLRPGIHDGHLRPVRGPHHRAPNRSDGVSLQDMNDGLGADRAGQCSDRHDEGRDKSGKLSI